MTDSVEVAIGVVDGQVIAQWHEPVREIAFDPKNAYMVGIALSRAAMEAHRGHKNGEPKDDFVFLHDELSQNKIQLTDTQRLALVNQVATILKTFIDQGKSPGYCALHCVDTVLAETAR